MNDNHTICLLVEEIEFLEAEKFANRFDKLMVKNMRVKIKRLLKIILPLFVGLGILFIFPSKITFIIIMLSIITATGIDFIKRVIISIKNNESNIINLAEYKKDDEEDNIERLIKENEIKKEHDHYFRENLNLNIFKPEEIDDFSLKEENTTEWITSETAINTVIKDIELLCNLYKIPSLNISDKEWDIFFDELCSEFKRRELFEEFFDTISITTRYTLAKSLVYQYKALYITDFIDSLIYINKKYNLLDIEISRKDILEIQKDLIKKVKE